MDENLNGEEFNEGGVKKKKGMGPLKGLFIAILIVFLICVIGLLIRMVVVGDGDYFKPIKDIFGIKGEKENTKAPVEQKVESVVSSPRYTLLNSDEESEDVEHYRISVDPVVLASKLMDAFGVEGQVSTEEIGGEVYLDIFTDGNKFVGLVLGYDYLDMLGKEETSEFSSFLEMFENEFEDIDKDEIISEIYNDPEMVERLSLLGINKKDLNEAINFVKDKGLIEIYVYGTEKLNELGSGEYTEQLEQIENDLSSEYEEVYPFFNFDEIPEYVNGLTNFFENEDYEDYGIEISEIN